MCFGGNMFFTYEQPSVEKPSTKLWVVIFSRLTVQTWLHVAQTPFMTVAEERGRTKKGGGEGKAT